VTPFDFAAERLQAATSFSRLEARGVLRVALRAAGVDHSAGREAFAAALNEHLPRELASRGIESADAVSRDVARAVAKQVFEAARPGVTPFDFAAERLQAATAFSRLEVRGILRLTLRAAGLDHSAGPRELAVVLRKLVPGELAPRGVESPGAVCEDIARDIDDHPFDPTRGDATAEIFQRLGGD
jgi:hypothetical protein